ncbi:uncharacterized protein LODBEIA_P18920 [Lodderomyces beijingensis]|uniref:Meiotic sister chromatid recombination protein 1 n=1 Tax=Lodderomyces beijingensis TaxID=1775926 RepID=A0ABP0ZJ52_9ASCO
MRLAWLALVFIQLVQANNYGFDQWSNNDLKQFLNDCKVKQDSSWDNSKLIEVTNNEAKKLENGYKKLKTELDKQLQPKRTNLEDYLSFSYLFGTDKKPTSIKDWFFESWDLDSLKKFLKHNGIKFSDKDKKSDLLKTVKNSFDKLAKKNKGSSYYPGSWLYDSWSDDDLSKWLSKYDIPYNKKSTRDQLIDKVKEFNYKATNEISDTKDALLDSLDLFDKSIFDKVGQVKDSFFETWSYSQLREWLYLHGFINESPETYVADLDKEKLIDLAKENKKYVLEDIQTWLKHSEKKVQPWLNKGGDDTVTGETSKRTKNLINDTFFVGIDNWSKDKLREFLNVRKVPYSIFTTRQQLVDLVKEHRADPIHVEADAYVVDQDFSTNSIKHWLKEQGKSIDGTRKDFITAFLDQFNKVGSGSDNLESQIRFYTPELEDYKHYLSRNVPEYKSYSDSQIKQAFKLVDEYFKKATETAREQLTKDKYSVEEALQDIQRASYQYASQFYDEIADGQSNISHLIIDARLASESFVKSLVAKLVKDWKVIQDTVFKTKKEADSWIGDKQKDAQGWIKDSQQQAQKGGQTVLKNVGSAQGDLFAKYKELSDKSSSVFSEYTSRASDALDDVSTNAGKKYEEAAKDAEYKYEQFVKLFNSKSDGVSDAAGKQYEKAAAEAQKKYDEYSRLFNSKLDELTTEAGKKYELAAADASKKFEEFKKSAKGTADGVSSDFAKGYELAAAEANKRYEEYTKLASKKYNEATKDAEKQWAEFSKATRNKVDLASEDAAKKYEAAAKIANQKYDEYTKLAAEKFNEWTTDASLKADQLYKEAGKHYEVAAKDASKKYDEYTSAAAAFAASVGEQATDKFNDFSKEASVKANELSEEAKKQYEIASAEAQKKYDEYSKIAGKKYEEHKAMAGEKLNELAEEAAKQYEVAKKNAGVKFEEYKKVAGEKAVEFHQVASEKAGEFVTTAKEEGSKIYNEAVDQSHKSYIKYSPKVKDWLYNIYRESLYHLGLFNNKIYEATEGVGEKVAEKWDSIIKTYSNADLKAYLRSFGYSYQWLSGLNRKELLKLAEVQEKLFSGYKSTKWDKSIGEIFKDAGEEIEKELGIKREPHGLVEHAKYYLGFNY